MKKRYIRLLKRLFKRPPVSFWVAAFIILLVGATFVAYSTRFAERIISVGGNRHTDNDEARYERHPLSGIRCEGAQQRPFAVMLSQDSETRPLSGIGQADMVVELPVVEGGITRLMALFACSQPEEIGSIRSSREDFIPLAAGFDAIYAHWGGSEGALELLSTGGVDNIDALANPNQTFYRKRGIPQPHNGFTSFERLYSTAEQLGYRPNVAPGGFSHQDGDAKKHDGSSTISVRYPGASSASYIYDPGTNRYMRWRAGTPEIDKTTGAQVSVAVLAVLRTQTRPIGGGYNDVDVAGAGEVLVFQNGVLVRGRWEKAARPLNAPLVFYDKAGDTLELVAGPAWISYINETMNVEWGDERL
ncbi:MAG: DUF3048 domain-containing protein [Candidatus Spechtbacterales bacterium]